LTQNDRKEENLKKNVKKQKKIEVENSQKFKEEETKTLKKKV